MIRIVNLKNYKPLPDEILFKVDGTSPIDNPYFMHSESERDIVCDKYEEHFEWSIQNNIRFFHFIRDIVQLATKHDIALGCWCHPKRCHLETIKNFIDDALHIPESDE